MYNFKRLFRCVNSTVSFAEKAQRQVGEWIEIALSYRDVAESKLTVLNCEGGKYLACALGLAMIGRFANPEMAYKVFRNVVIQPHSRNPGRAREARLNELADLFGIPFQLVLKIERAHNGGMPAGEIANRLKAGLFNRHQQFRITSF